jgi:transcriptional regulator NrdR family protein
MYRKKNVEKQKDQDKKGKPKGLRCSKCGCADFRDENGRPFKTVKTMPLPGNAIRRYKICRYCGKRIRTKEVIDG